MELLENFDCLSSVGFEFLSFIVLINNKVIKWDTCGQEKYKSLMSNFYRNTSLAIIAYAIDE